jgi:hypothetical protein
MFQFSLLILYMKLNVDSLLSDKNVLRIVAIISVFNLMGYVMLRNFDAVTFFVIIGFLTTYFSKNMIIVLLVSMVSTNFLVASRMVQSSISEGMKGSRKSTRKTTKDDKDPVIKDDSVATGEMESSGRPGKLDDAATFEAAHENLQHLLGPDAVKKMSSDTQALMAKQQGLQESLESLMPAVTKSMETLNKFGGLGKLESMIGGVNKVLNTIGGIGKR